MLARVNPLQGRIPGSFNQAGAIAVRLGQAEVGRQVSRYVGNQVVTRASQAADSTRQIVRQGSKKLTEYFKNKKRRHNEDEPKEKQSTKEPEPSQSNQTGTSQAMGVSVTAKQDDVPIKPFGRVSKTAPDYFTVRLPYAESNRVVMNTNSASYKELQFRLNSIFDVSHIDGQEQQPQGRDKWCGIFDYYRVLRCDVKMTIINNNARDDQYSRMLVGYQWGEEPVNEFATTIPAALASKRSHQMVLLGRNCDHHGNAVTLQYSYDESSFEHHVNPTDQDTIWTEIDTNPTVKRNIIFTCIPLQKGPTPEIQHKQIDFQYIFEAQYTVQFREAKHEIIRGQMQGTIPPQITTDPGQPSAPMEDP